MEMGANLNKNAFYAKILTSPFEFNRFSQIFLFMEEFRNSGRFGTPDESADSCSHFHDSLAAFWEFNNFH